MSPTKKAPAKKAAAPKVAPEPSAPVVEDSGEAEVQARFDVDLAQGFSGVRVDPTPNEAYTVAGVTGGQG